jgi:hypothetical protein
LRSALFSYLTETSALQLLVVTADEGNFGVRVASDVSTKG